MAASSSSVNLCRLQRFHRSRRCIHIHQFHLILLISKITGLNPSVQQDTEVPFSFIHGKSPSCFKAVTTLYMSFQAQWQNPSGILPSSLTMNSWPSLNTLHASIACPIGGSSPNICLESVFFRTVIFNLLLSAIISPLLLLFGSLLILTCRCFLFFLDLCSMHMFLAAEA